jgi:hypothetical protein
MSKIIKLTETELIKIVNKVISEGEMSNYEMYGKYIQNVDDDLALCIQSSLQNLEGLKEEIEADGELTEGERQRLLRFIEGIEDTYA